MSSALKTWLSPAEMQALTRRSDLAGALSVLACWSLIALSFAVAALWPNPVTFIVAVLALGAQQLGLAVLTHEAAHRSLFRTRWLNERLVDWLCARPIWTDVARYRAHHMQHHAHTGTAKDPDLTLIDPFPTNRVSLARKLLRDIAGLTGLRRVVGLLLMDLGFIKYNVAGSVEPLPAIGWRERAGRLLRNFGPTLISNAALAAVLAVAGQLWLYSAWVIAYLTSFSLFMRIRSLAEHACTADSPEVFENTRTTRAGWLARLTVAPFNVNYHQEHHLMASVPWYRLPRLHALLRERRGVAKPEGYLAVLRTVSAG